MSLDDSYSQLRSNMLTSDPLPSVKTAFSIISREESHKGTHSSYAASKSQLTVFVAFVGKAFDNKKTNNGSNYNNNRNYSGIKQNLISKHCNMKVHTIERCFEIIGYSPKKTILLKTKGTVNHI